jgi:adenosylcobinamide-phosphate synthase
MTFAAALPALVLVAAVALDLACGEPPAALHPVVWMGRLASALERRAPARGRVAQLFYGGLIVALVAAPFALAGWLVMSTAARWPFVELVAGALLLKSTFAWRALGRAGRRVRDSIAAGDIATARDGLRSLCSRDPARLEAPALLAAAVESLAENASDSFVAPVFFYVLFGLPGALAYRAVNTLDAMIGYRGRYEYLGKPAARLDDVLNFIPARLTAALLLLAGALARADAASGWRILARDGGKTASPNAGRPMAAMAGLLGVALEKTDHYRLGDDARPIAPETVDHAWRVVTLAALLFSACAALVLVTIHERFR